MLTVIVVIMIIADFFDCTGLAQRCELVYNDFEKRRPGRSEETGFHFVKYIVQVQAMVMQIDSSYNMLNIDVKKSKF